VHNFCPILYDIKQAYDSVQIGVLTRALHRIRLAHSFAAVIVDSLIRLTSRVRTAYGLSLPTDVQRSLGYVQLIARAVERVDHLVSSNVETLHIKLVVSVPLQTKGVCNTERHAAGSQTLRIASSEKGQRFLVH